MRIHLGRQHSIAYRRTTSLSCARSASEILADVATELEAVHDVGELVRVYQTEGMPRFVYARQIRDRVAQQDVRGFERSGADINVDGAVPVHVDASRFAIHTFFGRCPDDPHPSLVFRQRLEVELAVRSFLPGGKRPLGELDVRPRRDPVGYGFRAACRSQDGQESRKKNPEQI